AFYCQSCYYLLVYKCFYNLVQNFFFSVLNTPMYTYSPFCLCFFTGVMKMSMFSLNGKIALVTRASYGIGFAIASALHEAGATIVFNDIKQEFVDKGLAAYREKGIDAHGYVCDVTDETAVNAMVQ